VAGATELKFAPHADLGFGQAELRVRMGDAQIAGQCQLKAAR